MARSRIDNEAFEAARVRGAREYAGPSAVSATFDNATGRVIVALDRGFTLVFDPARLSGLRGANYDELSEIVVDGAGFTLSFPRLDADFRISQLIEKFGTLNDAPGKPVRV